LTIGNGAGIFNGVRGEGTGGNIEVDVRGKVAIDGTGGGSNSAIMNALYANSSGTSGDIVLRAGSLSLTDGGLVTTEADKGSSGTAGNINAVIQGNAFISGIPVDKTLPDIGNRPASSGGKFDVFFLADNTGSMGDVIRSVQTNSGRILSDISGGDTRFSGYDIGYGVGSYVGDPVKEKVPATIAYRLQQPITTNKVTTQQSIDRWQADNGGLVDRRLIDPGCFFLLCLIPAPVPNPEVPETNFFALQQIATSGQPALSGVGTGFNTGWRDGANRLIVWFGDAPSFENTVKQSEAIDALKANNVRVIAINTLGAGKGIDQDGQASAIAIATGGVLRNSINVLGVTDLLLNAIDSTVFSDYSAISTNSCPPTCATGSGLISGSLGDGINPVAASGNIQFSAQDLRILDSATISSSITGKGSTGNIMVSAPRIALDNFGNIRGFAFGTDSNTGTLSVNASENLALSKGASIANTVIGAGKSGSLNVNAGKVDLNSSSAISTTSFGLVTAGSLNVKADDIVLSNISTISAAGAGAAQAGDVTITANNLSLNQISSILSSSTTSLFDKNFLESYRNQLSQSVSSNAVDVLVGGLQAISDIVDAASQNGPQGNSANLNINIAQTTIINQSALVTRSFGQANAGDIFLTTGTLALTDKTTVNTQSDGTGKAGNLTLKASDRLIINNSEIAASAIQSRGGNIDVFADNTLLRNSSRITTSVFNSDGNGGNITINSRSFVAIEDSDILANAEDGRGGDLFIQSSAFLASLFSEGKAIPVGRNPGGSFTRFEGNARVDISADSASGQSGTVTYPNIDPSRGLVQLPLGLADRRQIDNPCSQGSSQQTRGLATRDEFVITGRGGIAKTPEDTRSVDALITPWATLSDTAPTLPAPSRSAQSTQPLTEATAVQQLADGRVSLVDPQAIALNLKRSCELKPIDEIEHQSPQEISLNTID
jgi:hypothetical protein